MFKLSGTGQKSCPEGQGNQEFPLINGRFYCVEYRGETGFIIGEDTNFFRITIADSPIALEPIVNKRIKNLQGKFMYYSWQCVMDKCTTVGGQWPMLKLTSFEVVE